MLKCASILAIAALIALPLAACAEEAVPPPPAVTAEKPTSDVPDAAKVKKEREEKAAAERRAQIQADMQRVSAAHQADQQTLGALIKLITEMDAQERQFQMDQQQLQAPAR